MPTWNDYKTVFPEDWSNVIDGLISHTSISDFEDFGILTASQIETAITVTGEPNDFLSALATWLSDARSMTAPDFSSYVSYFDSLDQAYLSDYFGSISGSETEYFDTWGEAEIATSLLDYSSGSSFWANMATMLFTRRCTLLDKPFLPFLNNFEEKTFNQLTEETAPQIDDNLLDCTKEEMRQFFHMLSLNMEDYGLPVGFGLEEMTSIPTDQWKSVLQSFPDTEPFKEQLAKNLLTASEYAESIDSLSGLFNQPKRFLIDWLVELTEASDLTELSSMTTTQIMDKIDSDATNSSLRDDFFDKLTKYYRDVTDYLLENLRNSYDLQTHLSDTFGNDLGQFHLELYDEKDLPSDYVRFLGSGTTNGEGYVGLTFNLFEVLSSNRNFIVKITSKRGEVIEEALAVIYDYNTEEFTSNIVLSSSLVQPETTSLEETISILDLTPPPYGTPTLASFITGLTGADTSLMDVRMNKGLHFMTGFSAITLPTEPEQLTAFWEFINRINSHANLEVLSHDVELLDTLVVKQYDEYDMTKSFVHNIVKIANQDREIFISENYDNTGMDEYKAGDIHFKAVNIKKFLESVLTASIVGGNSLVNGNTDPILADLPESTGCMDCESAVSPLAYLAELMNYAFGHIKHTSGLIDMNFLETYFFQSFSELPTACDQMEERVCQSRICVEVLNKYLESHPTEEPAQVAEFEKALKDYLFNTYLMLLSNFGTSYEEIRNARKADQSTRITLAERLGITLSGNPDQLEQMYLEPDSDTLNVDIEIIFGFRRYDRPALIEDSNDEDYPTQPEPLIESWRKDNLREIWKNIDYPTDIFTDRQYPIIDPDIISPDDFRNPVPTSAVPNNVFDLWIKRRQWIDAIIEDLRNQTKSKGIFLDLNAIVLFDQDRVLELTSLVGKSAGLTISGSTANDGNYKLVSIKLAGNDTILILDESLTDDTADGELLADKIIEVTATTYNDPNYEITIDDQDLTSELPVSTNFIYTPPGDDPIAVAVDSINFTSDVTTITVSEDLTGGFANPGGTITYKKLVTQLLGKSVPDAALIFDYISDENNFTYNSLSYSPWNIALNRQKDESHFSSIIGNLRSNSRTLVTGAKEELDLLFNLEEEPFNRLYELYNKDIASAYNPEKDAVTVEEWEEFISILVQSVKKMYLSEWIDEEKENGFLDTGQAINLDTKHFWFPIREPQAGLWPPIPSTTVPVIDPDILKENYLPDITIGKGRNGAIGVIDLWNERQEKLVENYLNIKGAFEDGSEFGGPFNDMMTFALDNVEGGGNDWSSYVDTLNDNLNDSDPYVVSDTKGIVETELKMSVDDFTTLMAIKKKIDSTDPSQLPSADELSELFRLVTRIHKINKEYPSDGGGWLDIEGDLVTEANHYWKLQKASIPKWRSSATKRILWQNALFNRSRTPFVEPDLMGPLDIARGGNEDMIWEIWNDRRNWIGSKNYLTGEIEGGLLESMKKEREYYSGISKYLRKAQQFFDEVENVGGEISIEQKAAFNQLVKNLRVAGLWNKMEAIYPLLGGNAASHAINAKDPGNYNITWNGTLTDDKYHDYFGSRTDERSNANYGDLGIAPDDLSAYDYSFGVFIDRHESSNVAECPLGCYVSASRQALIQTAASSSNMQIRLHGNDTAGLVTITQSEKFGWYMASRTANNEFNVMKDATLMTEVTSTESDTAPDVNFGLFGRQENGSSATLAYQGGIRFAFIGHGLTRTEMQDFQVALETYLKACGRWVNPDIYPYLKQTVIEDKLYIRAASVFRDEIDGLVSAGKIDVVNPMYGTSSQSQYNLLDPTSFTASHQNSPTMTYFGVEYNGSDQYTDTNWNPSTEVSSNGQTYCAYYRSREGDIGASSYLLGAYSSASSNFRIYTNSGDLTGVTGHNTFAISTPLNEDAQKGFISCFKDENGDALIRLNGETLDSIATSSSARPNANIFVNANNNSGATSHSAATCSGYILGKEMNEEEDNLIQSAYEKFMLTIGKSGLLRNRVEDYVHDAFKSINLDSDFLLHPRDFKVRRALMNIIFQADPDAFSEKIDVLYLMSSSQGDEDIAMRNLVSDNYHGTKSGSPKYDVDGIGGDIGSSAYINTGYVPGSDNAELNNIGMGAYVVEAPGSSGNAFAGSRHNTSSNLLLNNPSSGKLRARIAESNHSNDIDSDLTGLLYGFRDLSTKVHVVDDGNETVFNNSSASLTVSDVHIFSFNNGGAGSFSDAKINLFVIGTADIPWKAIRDGMPKIMAMMKGYSLEGKSNLKAFNELIEDQVLEMPDEIAFFEIIEEQRSKGLEITSRLRQLNLTYEEFNFLWKIRELTANESVVLQSEWEAVFAILTQVRKRRRFSEWNDEEQLYNYMGNDYVITLSQDYFRIPGPKPIKFPPEEDVPLTEWLANDTSRKKWQKTIKSRIDQEKTTIEGVKETVKKTEEVMLFKIRDALVLMTGTYSPDPSALSIKAQWVTDNLLIDAKNDCCQSTTRVSQAIETVQTLLWSVRTGQWDDEAYLNLSLPATTFDDDWKWIGSYRNWRSAMFVYLYPENILIPSLKRWQSPVFREIVQESSDDRRFNPDQACELAQKYEQYFQDVSNLEVQATCHVRDTVSDGRCGKKPNNPFNFIYHMFALSKKSSKIYWSTYNAQEAQGYKQNFWEDISAFENVIEISAAVPYRNPEGKRYIVLLAEILQKGKTEFGLVRYDMDKERWDEEPSILEIPDFSRGGSPSSVKVRQSFVESDPPHIIVQQRKWDPVVMDRKLNEDATDWEKSDWNILITAEQQFDGQRLLKSVVEVGPDEFMVIMEKVTAQSTNGKSLIYRIFGPHDDGKWKIIDGMKAFYGAIPHYKEGLENYVYVYYQNASGTNRLAQIERNPTTSYVTMNGSGTNGTQKADNLKNFIFDVGGIDITQVYLPSEIKESTETTSVSIYNRLLTATSAPTTGTNTELAAKVFDHFAKKGQEDQLGRSWTVIYNALHQLLTPQGWDFYWFIYGYMNNEGVGFSDEYKRRVRGNDSISIFGAPSDWRRIPTKCASQQFPVIPQAVNALVSETSKNLVWYVQLAYDANNGLKFINTDKVYPDVCIPYVSSPYQITENMSKSTLQLRKNQVQVTMKLNSNVADINYEYLREAYYFVPMQLGLSLTDRGHFDRALDWFRTVYDYTQPHINDGNVPNPRKIYYGLVNEEIFGKDFNRTSGWISDPLNPHSIASARANTYTKFTITSIVKCMQSYADSEYTNDTAESVPRARILYQTANELISLLLSEPNASVLIGLTVTVTDVYWLPRWNELKDDISSILLKSAAEQVVTDINTIFADDGTYPELKDKMTAAEAVVTTALADQISDETLSSTLNLRLTNQAGMCEVAMSNAAVGAGIAELNKQSSAAFGNAVATVTGYSVSAMQANGASLPFLMGDNETYTVNPSLINSEVASFTAINLAAPSPEANWLRAVEENRSNAANGLLAQESGFLPSPDFTFCIPRNPVFESLQLKSELNLFKIRNCRNIAGVKRELDPYAAPTDTFSGMPVIGPGGQLVLPGSSTLRPTQYKYQVLVDRAKELVGIAQQIEAAFLSTLEKLDAERYSVMKAKQDIKVARATVRLQDLRVKEAESGVDLAKLQQEKAVFQAQHFTDLLATGISAMEKLNLAFMAFASVYQAAAASKHVAASTAKASIGTSEGTSFSQGVTYGSSGSGGSTSYSESSGTSESYSPSGRLSSEAAGFSTMASFFSTNAGIVSAQASYERRSEEWEFQKNLAGHDIRIGQQQVKIAQDHVRVVGQERNIASMQADHAEQTMEFLSNKFTNVELYRWMSGVLEGVYSYFLQEASATAAQALTQLAFERQLVPPPFIQGDYWVLPSGPIPGSGGDNSDRRGLTGSARLLQDIYKMDQYAFSTDTRKMQISKIISLADASPIEFQLFKQTGIMTFGTPMEMFDRDFPGHYMRLIKQVKVSVVALIPASKGIKATLSSTGMSRVVIGGDIFQQVTVRRDPESVALSSPLDATGRFELQQESKFLNPFEAMGVDTFWEFRMEKASNQFSYDSIADIQLTIEYESLNSFDYRAKVINELGTDFTGDLPYSFRQNFSDAWFDLNNPDEVFDLADPMKVNFITHHTEFPPNVYAPVIQQLVLYFIGMDGEIEEINATLRFTYYVDNKENTLEGQAQTKEGLISTRRGNASSWLAMVGKPVEGRWELVLPIEAKRLFKLGLIRDIIFVITFEGETPAYSL